ncbi:bifunctional DNA primase/polymerase [Actinomadura barringtoniae]|uniref:Bifunctional DNA primase/polymerase n=1 Tax=Actinomadura barringtoniae TaxID=1427535 RepID=A0A939PF98_9ACTN|nr:bifunctional DNA primase/polymerase [Actinomadura barringtoniae]MBO2451475.1 bifunctional DNA primase/polymerase [Actinomadura barringtoniae]
MLAVSGSRRQKAGERLSPAGLDAALAYAALGWPCFPGTHSPVGGDRACSCDRIGCPDPGAHPVSAAWAIQATTDPEILTGWWAKRPEANVILPTGRVFDVFDIPASAGNMALDRIARDGLPVGPVAAVGADRHLFFVATRGAPADEDEWWSCHLDCSPENVTETPGMRWHCRESYVAAPPSVLPYGRAVTWLRPPETGPLPDPLRLLEVLADSCEAAE